MQTFNCEYIEKKKNIAEILFFAGLTIELLVMVVGHSPIEIPFRGRLLQAAFVLFGCKVLLTKYSYKEWITIILLGIVGVISYFTVSDEWVIRIVMFVVASKNIELVKVTKYIFWVSLTGMLLIMLGALLGIGNPLTDIRHYGRGEEEVRWCFGFNHANNVHGTMWYVVALGLYSYLEKTKWYHYVLFTIANLVMYMLTVSRGGVIVVQIVIIAAFCCRYWKWITKQKWVYVLGGIIAVFCAGIGVYAVAHGVYGTPWLEKLSSLLTGRIEMLTWYEKVEYWTMWGSVRDREPTDVGFITILADYGYAIFGLYVLVILIMIVSYCKKEKFLEFAILVSCVFYTFMESTYTINVTLLTNLTFVLLLGNWNSLFDNSEKRIGNNESI